MIDIHCHVLPGIDDGSRNVEMSIKMLRESGKQGVTWMCFTPHFYADMTDPDRFLNRRDEAAILLQQHMEQAGEPFPRFVLGSEVHYYRGIGKSEDIRKLCIGRSNYFLLEPPFRTWSSTFLEDVRTLRDELDLKVIIAHIERYFDQDKHLVQALLDEPGIYIQTNGESLLDRKTKKKVLNLIKDGKIQFLGSDCHNMEYRTPNLEEAGWVIEDKLGPIVLERIENNSEALIKEAAQL